MQVIIPIARGVGNAEVVSPVLPVYVSYALFLWSEMSESLPYTRAEWPRWDNASELQIPDDLGLGNIVSMIPWVQNFTVSMFAHQVI